MLGRLPHPDAQARLLERLEQLLFNGLVGVCSQLGLTVHGWCVPMARYPRAQLWDGSEKGHVSHRWKWSARAVQANVSLRFSFSLPLKWKSYVTERQYP